ncbi:MAG: hypothetical protein U9P38_04660, partial [Campylobacterota bacterium]|nr:hypothetical protein [Campylobacterota bacterium]
MKYLKWFIGVLATLLTMIYVVLFTSIGNDLLKPFIEEEIQKQTKLDSKLRSFSLSLSDFGISLDIDKENSVFIDGNFSVIEQSFNVNYKLELNKLENLEPLTQLPVQGRFHTDGTVDGDMKFIKVEGVSDVAQSKTTYKVELTEFNSTSIIAKVRDAKLVSLLHLGKQNSYASADINLDINFRNIKPHELDGDILLISKGGKIDLKVMKDDFNITLPKTAFSMNMNAKLQGDKINYNYLLRSNLAKISSSGVVTPQSLKTDIRYGVDIRGEFRVNGKVKGDEKKLVVDGKSDFASSDTHFVATLKDFEPATLKATMKNLKMKKVLYLLKQPHYADAIFSLDVDINDARSGNLKGTVISNIKKGLLDSKYLTKAYGFESKMPQTTFKAKTITILDGDIVDTKVDFNSSLVNFDIKRARFNIADSSLVSDYKTQIPSLDKFFFVTQRHMKGGVDIDGQLKQDDNLELTIHTKVVGGRIDAKLYNDDFHADIKSVQTIDALHILIYPELFN